MIPVISAREKLGRLLCGIYSTRFSWFYVSISYSIYGAFLLWSVAFFPGEYSIFLNAVSNLGDPFLNPWPGWGIFSAGICTFGFLMIPHAIYIYKRISILAQKWATRFLVASIIGYAGHVGVGVFSEAPATLCSHAIAAAMTFGGLLSAAMFSWPAITRVIKQNNNNRSRMTFAMIFMIMIVSTTTTFVMTFIGAITGAARGVMDTGLLSMLFWEWMLVLVLALHVFLLTALVNMIPADQAMIC